MAWVQLPDIPIEFYNPVAVTRIASRIWHPIWVYRATQEGARGKYARVCVEVDLTKPLLSKYTIEGKKYLISYEGLNDLCTTCGKYENSARLCKCHETLDFDPIATESELLPIGEDTVEKAVYGGWMKARTRKQRKQQAFQDRGNSHEVKTQK
ncbi:hypothetical protein LINGRAHAP2_LOCUS17867 [Linum grandiflorum]